DRDRGRDQEPPAHQRRLLARPARGWRLRRLLARRVRPGAGQCHRVARMTAAMTNPKPTTRFHAPRAERPGTDPPAREYVTIQARPTIRQAPMAGPTHGALTFRRAVFGGGGV